MYYLIVYGAFKIQLLNKFFHLPQFYCWHGPQFFKAVPKIYFSDHLLGTAMKFLNKYHQRKLLWVAINLGTGLIPSLPAKSCLDYKSNSTALDYSEPLCVFLCPPYAILLLILQTFIFAPSNLQHSWKHSLSYYKFLVKLQLSPSCLKKNNRLLGNSHEFAGFLCLHAD